MAEAPEKIGSFILNHKVKMEIDTAGNKDISALESAKWARLAAGINNVTPASNETATNDEYYDGDGWGTSDVTSKRYQFTIAGHRLNGDAAQDYIAGKQLDIGDSLKTLFKFTYPDESYIVGVVTLTNIQATGGAPGAKQTFSVVVVFNGKPKYVSAEDAKKEQSGPTL
ncbi:capsid protein [Lactobacillus agilis]|uniref:Capsid protein n=1 Tax=Ligilactobacillus agilis TaxID=1601 RepID=A0A848C5M1_9LACO|nr:capsid protein [Ligilactobacillus agilis]NME42915.1 capsid protein [Ligilactobacillus agilis]